MLDLADKPGLRWLAALVADLRAAAPSTDVLLVGATARDVLLSYAHGIPLARATEDADVAFSVPDWAAFAAVRQQLLSSGRFQPTSNAVHMVRHEPGIRVDLIPFGGVEGPDGSFAWPPDHAEVLVVLGFAEARATAVEVSLPGGQHVHVAALPMLALLKLFAWAARHATVPRKDAFDFFAILANYVDAGQSERLYGEAAHLLEVEAFDYQVAGAWLLGHDARTCVEGHSERAERIVATATDTLEREASADGALRLVGEAPQGLNAENALRLLAAFHFGFAGRKTQ